MSFGKLFIKLNACLLKTWIFVAHQSEASTSNFHSGATVQNSSKFRAYVSAVDKALKSFENTTEWADLIAALGKLGKVADLF